MKDLLAKLVAGQTLSINQSVKVFEQIMSGQVSAAQLGAMLALIQSRGATVEEITGAATVMRQKATAVSVPAHLTVIDTCGTGGDHASTFNISTAAAIVAGAAGRPQNVAVAKHGNRSVTSLSGSSQVFEALGVKLRVTSQTLSRCLDEAGLCFCFAPAHHPAMKHAMPVRGELGFRTIFNVLGPLTNPAGAKRQVMGVFSAELTDPIAQVLGRLGSEQAMVVHGSLGGRNAAGLDELTTTGPTRVSHLRHGQVETIEVDATSLGLRPAEVKDLQVDSPGTSAELIRAILSGQAGAPRDIVCLNSAAALLVAGVAADLQEGLQLASEVVDNGSAAATLDKLIALTAADPSPAA